MLAYGMTAEEVAIVLSIKADIVNDIASLNKELTAKYAKRLKGRRQRKKSQMKQPDHRKVQEIIKKCAAGK